MTTLSPIDIAAVARQAGFTGYDLTLAVAVCLAESGGRTEAMHRNTNGSTDFGLWQINSVHADLLKNADWANRNTNAAMAFSVFKDAKYKWTPWSTFNSGAYRDHLGAAVTAVASAQGSWVVITSGGTLSDIAFQKYHDASKWVLIWNDPNNATVKSLRHIPSGIRPGDRFWVPAG